MSKPFAILAAVGYAAVYLTLAVAGLATADRLAKQHQANAKPSKG